MYSASKLLNTGQFVYRLHIALVVHIVVHIPWATPKFLERADRDVKHYKSYG